jgi:unsaturated rhamnogalacturonyl hydrolase
LKPSLLPVLSLAAATLLAQPAAAQTETRSIRDVVESVARHQLREVTPGVYKRGTWEETQLSTPPKGVTWTYQWGVTLYGLLRATDALGDKTFAEFAIRHNQIASSYFSYLRWLDTTYGVTHKEAVDKVLQASGMSRFVRLSRLDFCGAMGHSMLEGFLRHGAKPTPDETEVLEYITDYISKKQGRIEGEGVLYRPENDHTLWIDDLYMSCPFLIRRAKQTGQTALLDDAAKQILGMAKRQQDENGVWFHAAWVAKNKRTAYKWSRANGWAMVTMVEVLSVMPENHPDRPAILAVLRKHVEGVKKLQKPSGLWPQVIDQPDMWDETSSTAMFSYAMARAARRGWIAKENLEVARKAFAGVMKNVAPNGDVLEVSEGTGIGETLEFYRDRRRPVNDHHGPGPVMMAGAELLEIEKEGAKK